MAIFKIIYDRNEVELIHSNDIPDVDRDRLFRLIKMYVIGYSVEIEKEKK